MDVRVYRAATMREALALVSQELGPDAAILHTREIRGGLLGRLLGRRQIEVTASIEVNVPSRLPERASEAVAGVAMAGAAVATCDATGRFAETENERSEYDDELDAGDTSQDEADTEEPSSIGTKRAVWAREPDDERESFRTETVRVPVDQVRTPTGQTRRTPNGQNPRSQASDLHVMLRELANHTQQAHANEPSELCFRLFTDLLDAEIPEELARQLVDRVRSELKPGQPLDESLLRARILRLIEASVRCSGPIRVQPGEHRIVALVGPTGVGKTTTIAKLAANYRLRENRSVGFITVDTYRIAAVEQIRTYAEIIDLPMQVVSSPGEIEAAVQRMRDLDLILLDTAGRSPRDSERLAELQDYLKHAHADEVHLVLSTTASTRSLIQTAEQFSIAGPTHLILTKLDEATGLGGIYPLIRDEKLPLSYLTNGQNVPDDIDVAESSRVARAMLGLAEPVGPPVGIDVQG